MGVVYECYYCHEHFPLEERLDGFDQGYRVGFLCPHCGSNIKDNLLVPKQRLDDCQKKWLNRAFWLSVPFILSIFVDRIIPVAGHEIDFRLLMPVLFVFCFLLMILFVPCTRRAGVFMTEMVEKP